MKQFVVDAFTPVRFRGNPAAVCLAERPLSVRVMQAVAGENNLSETAFVFKEETGLSLRWFTPGGEIDLCGHATLAAGFVLLEICPQWKNNDPADAVSFRTRSGLLTVRREGGFFEMEFPAYRLSPIPVDGEMEAALGVRPKEAWLGRDLVCLLENAEAVRTLSPDMAKLMGLPGLLCHVTAAGERYDCVSRSFAPKLSVPEDPVCGSGHCHIAPLWAEKLGKQTVSAYQASKRGGELRCRVEGEKVFLGGEAVLFSSGEVWLDAE